MTLRSSEMNPDPPQYPRWTGELRLIGYHDSSWGKVEDGRTVGGWIWVLSAKDASVKETFSPLQWSNILQRVAKSTFGGKTLSCTAAPADLFHCDFVEGHDEDRTGSSDIAHSLRFDVGSYLFEETSFVEEVAGGVITDQRILGSWRHTKSGMH